MAVEAQDPEERIEAANDSVGSILSKLRGISDTIAEAESRLEQVAGTVSSVGDGLDEMRIAALDVTGLLEAVPSLDDMLPVNTPIADAILANSLLAGADDPYLNEEEIINECSYGQRIVTGKFAVDDYNFETSQNDLLLETAGSSSGEMRVYEYPAGVKDSAAADARAALRIAECEAFRKTLSGKSQVKAFMAGGRFTMSEHQRSVLNQDYIIHSLHIEATPEHYGNKFEALPASVAFRPPRNSQLPRIHGTQTAIVVGPSGEEIFTDNYGRVKVQFHWDQEGKHDEKSSCWIRVAQGWTGKGWGIIFTPRIGMEVVVSFLEGDPDRPLITGMVYNAQQIVPYELPANQTRSTIKTHSSKDSDDGYNELRFEDKKGDEEIFLHAEKDYNIRVENDRVEVVKNDAVTVVHNNRQIFVEKPDPSSDKADKADKPALDGEAIDALVVKGGNRKTTVFGPDKSETHINEGTYEHIVGKTYTLTVKGDSITIEATGAQGSGDIIIKGKTISLESTLGDITVKSAKDFTLDAKMNVNTKAGLNMAHEAQVNFDNKAGVNFKAEAGVNLDNKAGAMLTNDAGAMMTNKAGAMQTVDGGGMLILKGGMVMIN